jgi:hypothetical protein
VSSPPSSSSNKKLAAHPFVVVQFSSLIAFWIAYAAYIHEQKNFNFAIGTFFVAFAPLCLITWRVCRSIPWDVQEKYLYPMSAFPCVITFVWAIFW